jgi:hypothetical protein
MHWQLSKLGLRGLLAFMLTSATALALAVPAGAAPSFTVAPNSNHSKVLATPFGLCRTALANPNGVLFIGDSITALGFDNITAQFAAAGRPVCIDARGGRRTDEGVAQLYRYYSSGIMRPSTPVVMALGSNDVVGPVGGMKTNIGRTMALLGSGHQVYWVHVFNYLWWYPGVPQWKFVAGTRRVGEEIKWGTARYRNLTAVQWPTLVKASYPKLLSADLLHPTPAGNAARTRLILTTMKPRV